MNARHRLSLAAILVAPTAASAQQPPTRPEVLAKLFDCRKLTNDAERVQCYDRQIGVIEEAERKRDIVVVDRSEIRRTRRTLFGLTLPSLKLFGNDDTRVDEPEFTTIETTLREVGRAGNGWSFTLEDGARWVQTDSVDLATAPKPGMPVRIRKGAMGSYLANVNKQTAIRVRRIN